MKIDILFAYKDSGTYLPSFAFELMAGLGCLDSGETAQGCLAVTYKG
jgi:hypothetical protein